MNDICTRFLWSLTFLLHIILCNSDSSTATETDIQTNPPNIVFLLADDLGWNDVGYHGSSDILTPNIDSLHETGLEIAYHYVQPQCTPSRAAFLTGRFPIRYGLHHDSIGPSDTFGLPLTETLLPEELKRGGYDTFMVGKWHLGFFAWEYTPTFRGFDKFYGFYNGAENYDDHSRSWDGVEGYDLRDGVTPVSNDDYATYYQRDKCIEYIQDRDKTKPFFLYASFQAVHSPNQVPTGDVWKSYKGLSSRARKIHATKATIMDDAIGDIIDTIKNEDIWENTIVIFTSDNGAIYNAGSNYPLRGSKSTIWEGGIRVPSIVNGGFIKDSVRGTETDALFHIVDWLPTFLEIAGIDSTTRESSEMDGMSQLSVINGESSSVREGFLIHTDPLDCQHVCGSYRYGKWKIIRDPRRTLKNERTKDGCFWTDDFKKEGSTATIGCSLSERIDTSDLACGCGTTTCLFDIENDPCEEVDLSEEYPLIMEQIYAMLAAYNKSDGTTGKNQIATPLSEVYPPDTDGADPKLHDDFWTPWLTSGRIPRDSDDPSDLMVSSVGALGEIASIVSEEKSSEQEEGDDQSEKLTYVSDDVGNDLDSNDDGLDGAVSSGGSGSSDGSDTESTSSDSNSKFSPHGVLKWMLIVVVGLIVVLSINMIRINYCQKENSNGRAMTEIAPLLKSDHYLRHTPIVNE